MAIVVRLSATVLLDHTLFRMTGIQLIDLHDTFDLGLPVSQYEDGDQIRIVLQHNLGTASYDHKGFPCFRLFLNIIELHSGHIVCRRAVHSHYTAVQEFITSLFVELSQLLAAYIHACSHLI